MGRTTVAASFTVERGQTYLPCGRTLQPFVVERVVGDKAKVWHPFGGPRGLGTHRWVALRSMHPTGTTDGGKERRTGYRLHSGPPAPGQELCGACMRWFDADGLAVSAWGYGHSTCTVCKEVIDRQYSQR